MAKKPAQRKAKTPAKKKAGGKKPAKPKTQQKSAPRKSAAKSREAHWVKCISTEGNFRGVAIHAKDLVQEIVDMHGLEGIAAKGLGEAVLGALFIASNCKEGEKINLNIQGSGHYRQVLVDAYPEGIVRGYVIEREDPESTAGPSRGPWGEGSLSVLRTKSLEREQPYIGTVPLVTGHLAKDLTYYWLQSEQIPSAVGIVVDVEKKKVKTAAGFIVQVLPNASPQEVSALQSKMEHFPSLAKELGKNSDPVKVLSKIFENHSFTLLEDRPLRFECQCSQERVERALMLIGPAELSSIINTLGKAMVRCDFCSKDYEVKQAQLQALLERIRS